jgi:aspartate dehydrogenase
LDSLNSETVIFQGNAKEAVSLFPANINVAALLSLTGIGSEKTKVKIVADPNTDKNTHHIEASGNFGKMTFTIENFPDSNNPKTSRLAILSAIETLRKYCSDEIQIGT